MLDERWIRSLHVETLREEELHAEREPHVLFQASTIGALLEGAYDGDLTFAELAEQGDHNALLAWLDELIPVGVASCAVRVDARFDSVRARSVPRQEPPYRPLTEVVAEQRIFDGGHVLGSSIGGTARARIDASSELRVELPPGIELADPELASATHAAVELVERAG